MQPVDEKNEKNEKNVTKNNVIKMIPTMNNKQTKDVKGKKRTEDSQCCLVLTLL